ncbi:MAG: patatin-like phospholipase family protein [Betaproteobacteria bacterium]|nr:patatin-like phospholipase family protein [Betaproteobacteria bacterium]MDH5221266.1 patatin-like phospholipase family protein [Betaproteobacteria bacterium]MDH5349489.1 patatin-like phospholipase family protein [Betaproteobacteria bacterium]
MARFRILSLDGGGIRGLISAMLLIRLSRERGLEGWLERADLLAGTSTGALIALLLARGVGLEQILSLYHDTSRDIFDDSWLDNVKDMGTLIGAQYHSDGLKRHLQRMLGEARLRDLRKRVLITAFDLDNEHPRPEKRRWKPKLFHNFPGRDSDGAMPAWKVGLYTCAAPTFFPTVDGFVDGGVFANNPSMCALAQTQDARIGRAVALKDVALFSLGTGSSLLYVKGKRHDWGYAQWAQALLGVMFDGTVGIADYQCRQLLGGRYRRLAPAFAPGEAFPLDCVDRIAEMVAFAERVDIAPTAQWLRRHWR